MNKETFFENIEFFVDSPNGIDRMRNLILQLAVQGKFELQNPNDESASILLEKVKTEKENLIKEKNIRQFNQISSLLLDDIPFELPNKWIWTKIGEISLIKGGKRIPKGCSFSSNPTPHIYIQVTNMKKGRIIEENLKFIDEDVYQSIKKYFIEKDDLYITIAGTIGEVGEVPDKFHKMNLTENAAKIIFRGLNKKYFLFALKSDVIQKQFLEKTNQQAQPKLALKRIADAIIPIPPLEEQKRIVARVDQLMALCDKLEARQQEKHDNRIHLNNAALDKLLTAPTPEEFAQHWQRICDNFDLLYDAPETVGEFRKAILQLAVQGKLVRQDANDEPAAVLMEKIRAEKESLVKEGKIRKQKAVPPVEGSDGLFELPENWQWDRFANVTLSSEAGWSPQCEKREREGNEWGVLKVSAVSWDVFKPHENKALPSSLEPRSQHEVKVGDFLLSRANTLELVAKSVVVEDSPPKLMMSDKLIRLHLSENVERRFFNIFNNCSTARGYYAKEASGTSSSMRNVSRECILKMPVPVPPLQEQRRIVAKVDKLMTLCDELEAGLVQAQTDGGKLMEAVVHHVLAG